MRASVIVLSWNGMEYLADCLDAIFDQGYPDVEVIVVDNGSTDGSADLVAERYVQVELIRNKRNLGFAAGNNIGLQVATGDALVLLNQDTVVQQGWLTGLMAALEDESVGTVGCKILYPDGETIQHAGGWIEWPLGLARHYGQGEEDVGQWDFPRSVEYVTGASMAFRRDVLERVGPLDEAFWPGYFEDADFCRRVRDAGYQVRYAPEATLLHSEGMSFASQAYRWESHHRGRLRFVLKHTPPDQFLGRFVQAEELYQPTVIDVSGSRPLCLAYLETISQTPSILSNNWQAEWPTVHEVVQAFRRLHCVAWNRDWDRAKELIQTADAVPPPQTQVDYGMSVEAWPSPEPGAVPRGHQLQEIEFRSVTPIIGPIISWLRSSWYGIAAKWGIRHLMQQQEAINREYARHVVRQETLRKRYVQALEQRLAELADENALLAAEIANLGSRVHDMSNVQGSMMDKRRERGKD